MLPIFNAHSYLCNIQQSIRGQNSVVVFLQLYFVTNRPSCYSAGNSLNPLFDNGEFQSSHVQRAYQYLKLWESAGDSLDHFWFIPGQVMGDHAECIETLTRWNFFDQFFVWILISNYKLLFIPGSSLLCYSMVLLWLVGNAAVGGIRKLQNWHDIPTYEIPTHEIPSQSVWKHYHTIF